MQVTTVRQLQALVRGRRTDLALSQGSVAETAGTSRKWLSEFERGATTAVELPLVLRVLAALDMTVLIAPNNAGPGAPAAAPDGNLELDLDEVLREYINRAHG